MVERAIERADVAELPPRTLRRAGRPSAARWLTVTLVASSLVVAGGAFLMAKRRGAPARFWTETPLASLLGNEGSGDVAGAGLSPSEILAKADDLRAKGQWLAATALYESAARADRNGEDGYRAMVAAGLLRLDHLGDPTGALGSLSAAIALRPNGALTEQARWTRIESLRAVGDRAAEEKALVEFVELYPEGPFTELARQRLTASFPPAKP
jgi:tetratricopeptide (TPR) repeat protein